MSIAKTLNSEGSLTRDGSQWRFSTVRLILTHPAYKGEHQLGINMPPLVGGTMWQRAQDHREKARSLLRDPKLAAAGNGILRGMRPRVEMCPEERF
jgi:hypothetical protein